MSVIAGNSYPTITASLLGRLGKDGPKAAQQVLSRAQEAAKINIDDSKARKDGSGKDVAARKEDPKASANKSNAWGQDAQNASALGDKKTTRNGELSQEDQSAVQKLKARDREVRNHEAAHLSAASGIARSGANFSYERGPDGQRYAVGGDVSIDTSPVSGDPSATIRKAEQIRRAALAPSNPSAQDLSVAAAAAQMMAQAQAELARNKPSGKTSAYDHGSHDKYAGRFLDVSA